MGRVGDVERGRAGSDARSRAEAPRSVGIGAQVLLGLKNPASAFVLIIFLGGVAVAPAMSLACNLSDYGYASSNLYTSDYFALQVGFVLAVQYIAFSIFDCLSCIIIRGSALDAAAEGWMGTRMPVNLYLVYAGCLFGASLLAYRLWFAEESCFRIVVLTSIMAAPICYLGRVNSLSRERELLLFFRGEPGLRDHVGSILCLALVAAAVAMALLEGVDPSASLPLVRMLSVSALFSGGIGLRILDRKARASDEATAGIAPKGETLQISLFMGIRVTMRYCDCKPPHFRVEYAGCGALVDIVSGCVFEGALPNRQLKCVLAWAELHKDELMQDWELAADGRPLNPIAPLI